MIKDMGSLPFKPFLTRCASTVALLVCIASGLFAQGGSGTITGTLTDPSGAVVPGASVVISNTETGIDRSTNTNDAGIYVATFMQPGNYTITASKAGFGKMERKDLVLQVGRVLTIDFKMTVQTSSNTITVNAENPIVDTEKTEVSQMVSQVQVENLPIAGRRWDAFVLLTPNVTTDGGTGLISYRGISGLYNSNSVDGANNNQAFFSEAKGRTTLPYVYSMDSIQEYQVSSSNYSAELGQAAGGVVNAVTKSGTNLFHGDLFEYVRNPAWNAIDPFQKSKGIYTQPVHQQNQFGGSAGGRLIKDKLFFFLTYDGSRKVFPITYTSSATFPVACTNAAISAATCASANAYAAGLVGSYPRFQNQDVGFGKLDYQVNAKNRVNASFNLDNFRGPNSYSTGITVNNSSITTNGFAITHERFFVANWNSTLSSTMVNSFRFQWSRDLEIIKANSTGPSVSVQNVTGYGLPNALPRPAFPDEHRLQFSDTLSLSKGQHTIKAGFDANIIHELLINLFQGGGVYNYSGTSAFTNWVADVTGTNLGDGLTGRHFLTFVQVTDPVTGVGKDDFYDKDFDGFVEDTWKARPNLTVNLGVRYDIQLIPAPPKPNTSTPLTTLYTSTINIDKNNLAPRIGLAWTGMKGTVVRAGYGIFYGKTSNSTYYATRVENGVIQQTFNCNPTTCPTLTFPNLIFTPPGGTPTAPFAGAVTPKVVPFTPPTATQTSRGQTPDWVNPLVHEGEFAVEHQLPMGTSLSASYVFSRGMRLPIFVDTNIAPATTTKTFTVVDAAGASSSLTVPFYTSRIDATGPVLTGFSDVNSWYNSLVITFNKPVSHGLAFTANYTLAKATDGGQVPGQFGTFNGTDSPIDPYHRKLEYGRSDLDQRHRFVANTVWAPQFTHKIANKTVRFLVDGFNFSSIVTVSAGQGLTGTVNGSASGGPAGGLTGAVVNNSGTALSSSRFPGEPRNNFTGPGLGYVDFRVARDFVFKEKYKLALRGEAFNLFNFTNFFSVNSTEYNLSGTTLTRNAAFMAPTSSNNSLYGARQLQLSARFSF